MEHRSIKDLAKRSRHTLLWAALIVFLAVAPPSCDKDKAAGDEARQKAKRELIDSLTLFPGGEMVKEQIDQEHDALLLSFSTNEKVGVIEEFYRKAISENNYQLIIQAGNAVSYRRSDGKMISVSWYPRDKDIFGHSSVYHMHAKPLPPELRAPKQAEGGE